MSQAESAPQPTVNPTDRDNPYRALAYGHINMAEYEVTDPETGKTTTEHTAPQMDWDGYKENNPYTMARLSGNQEPRPFSSLEKTSDVKPVRGTSQVGRLGVIGALNSTLSRGIRK